MPYVPKPPKGQGNLYLPEESAYSRTRWNNDGTFRDEETFRNDFVGAASAVAHRSKQTPILLKGSTIWKPCSDYRATFWKVTRHHGVSYWTHQPWWSPGPIPLMRIQGQSDAIDPARFAFANSEFNGFAVDLSPAAPSLSTRNRLATEVMQKVADRKTNFGESLAESRQTINHLAKTAFSLGRAYLSARKGRWRDVAHHLGVPVKKLKDGKSLADKWLEYQYGWMPLMSDIYDTHALITKGFREKVMLSAAVRQLETTYSTSSGNFNTERLEITAKRWDKMKVFYSIDDSDLSKLAQMGLINPVEVAWAVVPFSFVVDWFLPVGNFLEALTARLGVTFIDGYQGAGVESKVRSLLVPGNPGGDLRENSRWVTTEAFSFSRTKLYNFPLPGLYFKDPFSTKHVISALALLRSLT